MIEKAIVTLSVIVCFSGFASAQELRSVRVKAGDCSTMSEGWVCYDKPSWEHIDEALEAGAKCKGDLKALEKRFIDLAQHMEPTNPPKHWYYLWIK